MSAYLRPGRGGWPIGGVIRAVAELRWYEWLDRNHHPELAQAVEEAYVRGEDAVRRIREERPRSEARSWEAADWWAENRHLLLLALMARPGPYRVWPPVWA